MVKVKEKQQQRLIERALQDSNETGLLRAAESGSNKYINMLIEGKAVDLNSKDPDGRTALSQASKHGHVETVELLLSQHGVDPNSMDTEGRTPLSLASEQWHKRVVESLIDRGGACTNLKDNRNRTPLHWTARKSPPSYFGSPGGTKESLPTVASLISHNIELDVKDSKGRTALSRFAKYGYNEAIELLLKQDNVNPNSKDDTGRTPISLAAERGHTQIVDMLINGAGADPDLKDDGDWTPLFWAIKGAENEKYISAPRNQACNMIRLLLNRDDVDPAAQDREGRTPLSWAVESPRLALEMCQVLLKRSNATLEFMDSDGRTPFSRATESGNVQVVQEILEQDCINPDSKDKDGRTPLSRAAQCGRVGVMKLLLMNTSIDPDSKDNRGRTPLWWAADCGQAESVQLLLETNGVDPESTDDEDCTPLLRAAKHGKKKVFLQLMRKDTVTLHILASRGDLINLQLLLKRGCHAGVSDKRGRTPLHSAALFGHADIANELLTRGAIADCKDNGGITPLHLAIRNKHHAIIHLLLEHSAETTKIGLAQWFTAYNRSLSDDVLELSQLVNGRKFIQFNRGQVAQLSIKPESSRRIFVFRNYSTWYQHVAYSIQILHLDLPGLLHLLQSYDHHMSVLLVGSYPMEPDSNIQGRSVTLQWRECAIAWTMVFSGTISRDGNGWRSMDHFSTLPYGWIPRDGAEFFSLFIQHLRQSWLTFCISAEEHLLQRRLHQMNSKGNSAELIHRLAEDLKEYAEVRKVFRGQIRSARKFVTEYSERFYQENDAKEMKVPIKAFEADIGEKIDQLDQTVKDLLQFEFAWVSINEAHRSATIATSMKRLSWITFVFLPAMFTSSLFGMNVNILETNPDWRWYLLFSGGCLILTALVWLFFKQTEIKHIVQRHSGTGSLDLFRGFTRHIIRDRR